MNPRLAWILALTLLAAPAATLAERVQSAVSAHVTFRDCVAGASACESVSAPFKQGYAGLPGESSALTSLSHPDHGVATARSEISGIPGIANLGTSASSQPTRRNGGNAVVMHRYSNTSPTAQRVLVDAHLTYRQTVPEEASEMDTGVSRSGAVAELFLATMNVDDFEVGSTAEEVALALLQGPDPSIETKTLASAQNEPTTNVSESVTRPLSIEARVEPGESVWLMAILQSLAANGAVVVAGMDVEVDTLPVD